MDLAEYTICERMPPLQSSFVQIAWLSIKDKDDARAVIAILTFIILTVPATVLACAGIVLNLYQSSSGVTPKIFRLYPMSQTYSLIFAGVTFVAVLTHLASRRSFRNALLQADIHGDFRFLQHAALCLVYTPNKITYRYRYIVRARQEGVTRFTIRYKWTGHGGLRVVPRNHNFVYEPRPITSSTWVIGDIVLDKAMSKGDVEEIQYDIITDTSTEHTASPYFGFTASSPKYGIFNNYCIVAFSDRVKIAAARRERYVTPLDDKPFRSTPTEVDGENRLVWPVMARLGRRYCLSWVYMKE